MITSPPKARPGNQSFPVTVNGLHDRAERGGKGRALCARLELYCEILSSRTVALGTVSDPEGSSTNLDSRCLLGSRVEASSRKTCV